MTTIKRFLHLQNILCLLFTLALCNTSKAQDVISAKDLVFAKLGVNDDLKFDQIVNQTIKVRGTVTKTLSKDDYGEYNLILYGYGLGAANDHYISLSIPANNAPSFAKIKAGDEITIQGKCLGVGGDVYTVTTRNVKGNTALIQKRDVNLENAIVLGNCALVEVNKTKAEMVREAQLQQEAKEAEEKRKWEEKKKEDEERVKKERQEAVRLKAQREKDRQEAEEKRRREGLVEGTWQVIPKGNSGTLDFVAGHPRPKYSGGQEEGTVVIKLAIAAKSGDIKKATIVEKRTTIKDKTIRASALESARQVGWKSSSTKYEVEVTYKFSK